MGVEQSIDLGKPLHETTVKAGLIELNPGFHFDMLTAIGQWHPYQASRQGVWFEGKHICSMDRDVLPEYKLWNVEDGVEEVTPMHADSLDNVFCVYVQILPTDPTYQDALLKAEKNDDNFTLHDNGKVFKWTHLRFTKVKGDVVKLGWRHVFEKILQCNISGVTRQSLGEKFSVDMFKFPMGSPEEVDAALIAE